MMAGTQTNRTCKAKTDGLQDKRSKHCRIVPPTRRTVCSRCVRILVLLAGTNAPSNTALLADAFAAEVRKNNIQTETIRIDDLQLAHFDLQHYDAKTDQGAGFKRLQVAIQQASGVVIATPIWNFSVPAHLKNLIDRMGSFALDAETRSKGTLGGKPFFFIFTGGAPLAAWKGLMRFTTSHVPEGIRYFAGTIAGKYYEPKCLIGRGKFGLVVDKRPESIAAMRKCAARFCAFVEYVNKTGKLPLWNRIVTWGYKKGQRIIAKL